MKRNIFILLIIASILIVFSTLIFASETIKVKDYIKGKFPVIFNIYLSSLGELDEYEKEFVDLLQNLPEEEQKNLAKEVYNNGFTLEILEKVKKWEEAKILITEVCGKMETTYSKIHLIVNTTDDIDDGVCDTTHCSLREAINVANKKPEPDTITFDSKVFLLSGTGVIKLTSPLPEMYGGGTTIDATGAKVTIDGGNLASFPGDFRDLRGLHIISSGNTVRGIRIIGMPGSGITITSDEAFRPQWPADNNTLIGVTVVNNGYGHPPFTSREDGIVIQARGASSSASCNKVINCIVEDNADDGIIVQVRGGGVGDDNIIMGNVVRGNGENGVEIDAGEDPGSSASRNRVTNNTVEGHPWSSIVICSDSGGRADNNIVDSNIVTAGLDSGICIEVSDPGSCTSANTVINNTVENHVKDGIFVGAFLTKGGVADGNIVKGNTIQRSGGVGIHIASDDNLIYHNNIIDNNVQARDYGINHWDNEGEGNYWSNYTGKDKNRDGIGDTPYRIPPNGVDNYPLMIPYR